MNARKLATQVVTAFGLLALSSLNVFAAGDPGPFFTEPKPLNSYATMDGGAGNQVNPKIASDGDGALVAAWNTTASNDPRDWRFNDVVVASSDDNGATWSAPKVIYGSQATMDFLAYMDNTWVAMWHNITSHSHTTSYSLNLFCARSTDGQNWTEPVEIYSDAGYYKDIEGDGDKTIIVSTGIDMLRSTDGGQSWSYVTANIIAASSNFSSIQIASAGNDKWYLLARMPSGPSNLYTSTDNGATWSGPVEAVVPVTIEGIGTIDLDVPVQELAARNNTIVATSYPSVATSIDGGATWTTDDRPYGVSLWYDFVVPQDVEVDGDGNWIMATQEFAPWNNTYPPDPSEYYVTVSTSSDPGAGWTSAVDADTSGTRTESPAVASLGNGGFAVVYERYATNEETLTPDGDIAITTKADAGSAWTQPVQVNDASIVELPYIDDVDVLLEMGENGTALAVWVADQIMIARSTNYGRSWTMEAPLNTSSGAASTISSHNIVYAGNQRWMVSWTEINAVKYCLSDDNGISWSAPQLLDGYRIAANGNGTIIKYNDQFYSTAPHTTSRLPAGTTTWEAPVALPPASEPPVGMVLMANTSGENWCLITRGIPYQVYTSNDDGRTWSVHAGTNLPRNPHFDLDDSGNIVVMDARNSVYPFGMEIYVSRSTNNGVDWSVPVLLSTVPTGMISVPTDFIYGDIAHFGAGIWVIGLHTSEYALSGDGGATWTGLAAYPFGEVEVSSRPAIAAKDNRILFAWQQDEKNVRNGDSDIYYSFGTYGVQTAAQDWQLYE